MKSIPKRQPSCSFVYILMYEEVCSNGQFLQAPAETIERVWSPYPLYSTREDDGQSAAWAVQVSVSRLNVFMQSDALSPYCPSPRSSRSLKEKKTQPDAKNLIGFGRQVQLGKSSFCPSSATFLYFDFLLVD